MRKALIVLVFSMCSIAASSSIAQNQTSKLVKSIEVECGVIVVLFAPNFTDDMLVEDLVYEAKSSVITELIASDDCLDPSVPQKKRIKTSTASSIDADSSGNNWRVMDDDPPEPPVHGDWVLVDTFKHTTKVGCVMLVVDGWIYRQLIDPDNGTYEYYTVTRTYTYNILGCEADEYGGPN